MKLSGAAKQAFEEWYLHMIFGRRTDYSVYPDGAILSKFYRSIESMEWGVYQDWFDSVGIRIIIDLDVEEMRCEDYDLYIEERHKEFCHYGKFQTRTESRIEAIEKANEIFNNREK
ncbi:hypothetical protein [Aquimarina macrocephali]|uniref:hypothetical protein n=1 Tax=Aquimarina macrocephali TaxID=666563 RepID=UPI003F67C83F